MFGGKMDSSGGSKLLVSKVSKWVLDVHGGFRWNGALRGNASLQCGGLGLGGAKWTT